MKVKSEREVAQSCPTPREPMDHSLPGSSVHEIFQARVLEWGAIAFSIALTRWTLVGKVMSLLFNMLSAAATAKSFQSCPTLCDPIDGSPPGPSILGILQARTLEWGASGC